MFTAVTDACGKVRVLFPSTGSSCFRCCLQVEDSIGGIDPSIKEAAYHAWLGFYNSVGEIGRDKTSLAPLASRFSRSIGLEKPPLLYRKTALQMGLKDVPGIRIRK